MKSPTNGFPTPGDIRLLGCVLASVAMHGALLQMPGGYRADRIDSAERPSSVALPARTLDGRLAIQAPRSKLGALAAVQRTDSPLRPTVESGGDRGSGAAPDAAVRPEPSLPVPLVKLDSALYYTADQLSRQPQPLSVIAPNISELLPPGFRGSVRLTLFINESGTVDRVVTGDSTLPSDIDDALSSRFGEGRFAPGEIEGIPVKAEFSILVEVSSED